MLEAGDGEITGFRDPEGVLAQPRLQDGILSGALTANAGDHVVFADVQLGQTKQLRMFKLHVTDVKAEAARTAKTEVAVPQGVKWSPVPMQASFNGDIRTIYQQKYVLAAPEHLLPAAGGERLFLLANGAEPSAAGHYAGECRHPWG